MATVTRNNEVLQPGKTFGIIEECDSCDGIIDQPRLLRFVRWEQPDMVAVVSETGNGNQPEFRLSLCPNNRDGCDEAISPNSCFSSAKEAKQLWRMQHTRCTC